MYKLLQTTFTRHMILLLEQVIKCCKVHYYFISSRFRDYPPALHINIFQLSNISFLLHKIAYNRILTSAIICWQEQTSVTNSNILKYILPVGTVNAPYPSSLFFTINLRAATEL